MGEIPLYHSAKLHEGASSSLNCRERGSYLTPPQLGGGGYVAFFRIGIIQGFLAHEKQPLPRTLH
jgi:hypothetical protein